MCYDLKSSIIAYMSALLTVFMIAIAVSSCESRGTYKEKHFPTRVGSGIR